MSLRRIGTAGAMIAVTAALAGCPGPKDAVVRGNADSVDILYDGDAGRAALVARQHCAQYERIPQQRQTKDDIITFQCVVP